MSIFPVKKGFIDFSLPSPYSYPPSPSNCEDNGCILIRLKDGSTYFVDKKDFIDLGDNELFLNLNKEIFEIGYYCAFGKSLGQQNPPFEEIFQDPNIYEKVRCFFESLFPKSYNKKIEIFRDEYLKFTIFPNTARIILKKYYEEKKDLLWIQNEMKHAEIPLSFPIAVQEAIRVMRTALYYPSEEAVEIYYCYLAECQKEILDYKNKINKNEIHLCSQQFSPSLERANARYNFNINALNKKISIYRRMHDIKSIPYRLQEYKNSECIFMRILADQASMKYATYCQTVLKCLQEAHADTKRQDLIRCLIGPEAYLLDYYDIHPIKKEGKHYLVYLEPITGNCFSFQYALENISRYDLEFEIRKDRNSIGKSLKLDVFLPEEIGLSEQPSIPYSDSLAKIQARILEGIKSWHLLNEESKNFIIEEIKIYNRWDEYNLENLSIPCIHIFDESIYGSFEVKFDGGTFLFNFHLSLYDFKLIVEDPNASKYNSHTTREWLDRYFPKK